jgi:hypothetical protein
LLNNSFTTPMGTARGAHAAGMDIPEGNEIPIRDNFITGNQPWQQAALAGGGTVGGLAGSGALGGAAAAALPPVAVAAAGAALIYGAWHLGEWIAEQPWNPLTHPRDLPQPRAVPRCDNPPKVIPIPAPPPAPRSCPPCRLANGTVVPIGTVGYRFDRLPPDVVQHGIRGSHLNLYICNQNPNNCRCFWQPGATVSPPPQAGWIPIQPFAN